MTGPAVVQWCNAWSHLLWLTQALHLKPYGSAGNAGMSQKWTNKLWGSPKTAGQVQVLGKNVPRLTWTSGLLRIYDYVPSRWMANWKASCGSQVDGPSLFLNFLVHHMGNLDGWMPRICGFLKYCSTLFNQRLTEGSPPWNSWNLGMPSYPLVN